MGSRVKICVHHHGNTDIIEDVDTSKLCMLHLLKYSEKFKYSKYDFLYFQTDGHSFEKGVRLLYDQNTLDDMLKVCKPYNLINIYVDHKKRFQSTDELPNRDKILKFNIKDYDLEEDEMGGADHYLDEEEIGGGDFDLEYEAEEGEYDEEGDVNDVDRQDGGNTFKVPDLDIDIDEEEFASDELRSENESSGDEYVKQGYVSVAPGKKTNKKFKLYNENKDGPFKFEIGMKFSSMEEFRTAVREYGVRERRALHFITNDNDRVQVGCEKGCRFYIWCGKLRDAQAVQIKTLLDDHLCTKPYYNNLISVKFLTEKYGDRIRHNPQWKVKDMMETIREELEVEVPRIKCSRVRKAALQGVFDSLKVHYSRVRDFGHELLKNNPQNRVDIRTSRVSDDDVNKFKRMYICYHALKQGWKLGCRPVLGLDGCFLKTPCGGQLLSAVGRDGNNMMFPVTYAIVESESIDSWKWFIELLGEDLSLGDGHGYTIISDQQKGLDNAIKHYLPRVEHRLCTRHLYANIRKRYKTGAIRKAFWFAACATYPAAHQRIMKGLEKLSKPLSDKLKNLPPSSWSKAFFGTHSVCDNVENNMSESFNSWILNERFLPILSMFQELHFKLMTRIRKNREKMLATECTICPNIKLKLDKAVTASRNWQASWDGDRTYMVRQGTRSVTVDLDRKTCDCRHWDLTGISCPHAVSAIHDRRHQPIDYVSKYYSKDMYLKAYSQSISALRGEEFREFTSACELLPPEMPTALRGRPKRLRRREEWEGGTQNKSQANMSQVPDVPDLQKYRGGKVMHCSLCKKPGHKKTTCPTRHDQQRNAQGNDAQAENTYDQNTTVNKQSGTCRPKLPVRRPAAPGVVIKDPIPTPKTTLDLNDVLKKNKGKVGETSCTKRKDRPYWMTNCLRKKKPYISSDSF